MGDGRKHTNTCLVRSLLETRYWEQERVPRGALAQIARDLGMPYRTVYEIAWAIGLHGNGGCKFKREAQ